MVNIKKIITVSILSLFLVSLVGIASAEVVNIDASSYSVWDNFIHTLQNLGLFTAAGQSRECSSTADYTLSGVSGYVSTSSLLSGANCNVALFNVFDKNWHFIDEYRSEDIGGFQISSTSIYADYPAIIEVYCCPYPACDSDSDCINIGEGIHCNTNYGSCYGEEPTYLTQIIKCENDQWMTYGTASYGEENYCNEGLNNYIDREGAEHCVLSTYSSVTDGTWCGADDECSSGQTQCIGEIYYTCSNGNWISQGQVDEKCGYTAPIIPTPVVLSGVIYDIQLFESTFQPGEEVEVRFRVDNNGDAGNYLIETGIIPKSVAEDWGFSYGGMAFSVFDWFTTVSTECCEGQPNIFAKTAYFNIQDTNEFSITIPKAPYSEITDLCYDNNYWDGEGEYVLYVTMKTGCYPEGEEVTYETMIITINETVEPIIKPTLTTLMTWTEFYSMSDESFSKKIKKTKCFTDADCPTKDGYIITCEDNEVISSRLYDVSVASCDDNFGIIDELLTIAKLGIGSGSYCEMVVDTWGAEGYAMSFLSWIGEKVGIESPKGYCIAESDSWYGNAWEGTLKMMGGMGLPFQYVMIITVMLLITLIGMVFRMVSK